MLPHMKAMVMFIEKKEEEKKDENSNNQTKQNKNVIFQLHQFSIFFRKNFRDRSLSK